MERVVGKKSERGFILLEIIVLGLVIMASLGAVRMLDRAARLNAADGARSQAIFLAREQLERLNYQGAKGYLVTGRYYWLGEAADTTRGEVTFEPVADVAETAVADVFSVQVVVTWNSQQTSGQVELEGRIKNERPTENNGTNGT